MQDYNKADQQLHLLSQIIAKMNRTFVPKKDDDSHTNLSFDAVQKRIYGHWIKSGNHNMIFCLDLKALALSWFDDAGNPLQVFPLEGQTISELESIVDENLERLGLNSKGFTDDLHYEIPAYDFANEAMQAIDADALNEWVMYRRLANHACTDVLNFLQLTGETRIWPHHFDTGIYVTANSKIGIGFGMAMEDSMVGSPYFYISGYALADNSIDYNEKPNLTVGEWKLGDDWNGAVLSLQDLGSDANATLATFIAETAAWLQRQ